LAGPADLVVASGPHTLRGSQFYRHHLSAYSLGNFVG
jgi:poly-gamma-glutamate capsule biosynthesis protein CapA/YwtB (metallophosphatase superfamily)